jgi:DNA-binding LacI/PurR family transcriptional regulator
MARKDVLSIKDIARAANVSHSTVSRALRNSPLVNPETADRIRRIAAERNFRLSAVGRSLATGRTYSIGVIVPTIADPYVAGVVSGVEEVLNARGYSVVLASSMSDPDREMKAVQTFEERRVDGLLLTGSRAGASYSALLAELKMPIVVINSQQPGDAAYSVLVDHTGASRAAVRFLIQLGHRRIAYVADRTGDQINAARQDGYRQILEESGIPVRPELVVNASSGPEGGMLAADQLLELADPPTAIFCYDDMTAVGVLASCRRHGLRVPEDLSVVGFDDVLMASYTHPPLTTVRQPMRLIGRLAAETLLNLLSGSKIDANRRLTCELIVRESTAPPPRAD